MLNLRGAVRVVLIYLPIILLVEEVWISKSPNENELFKELLIVGFLFLKVIDNSGYNLRYIMDNEWLAD